MFNKVKARIPPEVDVLLSAADIGKMEGSMVVGAKFNGSDIWIRY